jgi:hypothetical protein
MRKGWSRIRKAFGAPSGFDIIIANPPWGADISSYRDALRDSDYSLCRGQFDSADLFMEMAVKVLKPGGYLAFIVPDSLFSEERTALREMLLRETEIKFLGRLGEKLFDNVNRACAVVICRKGIGTATTSTKCLRLTPEARRGILAGMMTFGDAERKLAHRVPQRRFASNHGCSFDIDIAVSEESTVAKLRNCGSHFGHNLRSTRGVELSKRGLVCRCSTCGLWMPAPERTKPLCPHCRRPVIVGVDQLSSIVGEAPTEHGVPLLVGESVRRYFTAQGLWIVTDRKGIDYKDARIYSQPKLLVRKTGVGLSAAIDCSGAYTNQVVYIFLPKPSITEAVPLECFLGILNSRAMYYYLVKSHGETEWRSHPYVTQGQILGLPFPLTEGGCAGSGEVLEKMAEIIRPHVRANRVPSPEDDARIERLVARVFGLDLQDYKSIYQTLDSIEPLLPVRTLLQLRLADIFSSSDN